MMAKFMARIDARDILDETSEEDVRTAMMERYHVDESSVTDIELLEVSFDEMSDPVLLKQQVAMSSGRNQRIEYIRFDLGNIVYYWIRRTQIVRNAPVIDGRFTTDKSQATKSYKWLTEKHIPDEIFDPPRPWTQVDDAIAG
jgi:hypothetical protein